MSVNSRITQTCELDSFMSIPRLNCVLINREICVSNQWTNKKVLASVNSCVLCQMASWGDVKETTAAIRPHCVTNCHG